MATEVTEATDKKVALPTWGECELVCDLGEASALQEFIYEYEPADDDGAEEWRQRLGRLIAAYVPSNTRQRAGRASQRIVKYALDSSHVGYLNKTDQLTAIIAAEFEK